jgi:hypothetical protein
MKQLLMWKLKKLSMKTKAKSNKLAIKPDLYLGAFSQRALFIF